ncbi:hypothetical protein CITRIK5_70148 [Citricoccus sp. K5]|nr:hypothetical protein CITRIK5_70148 [Citricoccus sp. K5]
MTFLVILPTALITFFKIVGTTS